MATCCLLDEICSDSSVVKSLTIITKSYHNGLTSGVKGHALTLLPGQRSHFNPIFNII